MKWLSIVLTTSESCPTLIELEIVITECQFCFLECHWGCDKTNDKCSNGLMNQSSVSVARILMEGHSSLHELPSKIHSLPLYGRCFLLIVRKNIFKIINYFFLVWLPLVPAEDFNLLAFSYLFNLPLKLSLWCYYQYYVELFSFNIIHS